MFPIISEEVSNLPLEGAIALWWKIIQSKQETFHVETICFRTDFPNTWITSVKTNIKCLNIGDYPWVTMATCVAQH